MDSGKFKIWLCVVITLALYSFCTTEAAGRKEIDSMEKGLQFKTSTNQTDLSKASEKTVYPKKASSLKKRPTKSPQTPVPIASFNATNPSKNVTEIFTNLPEDDLEFIKELDKQFKIHGENLKIKVQRDNNTTKINSKRTIEGDLGYGYAQNGYTYERPKFMFYPYSQKDIPYDAPAYYPQYESTSVTIEPSYSYELKPQSYLVSHDESVPQNDLPQVSNMEQAHAPAPEHAAQQDQYQEPVIVLRIPGPTKYASHLQALLQQYLEIRAAQYLKILQETDSPKGQDNSQNYEEAYVVQEQHYKEQGPAQHVEPIVPTHNTDYAYQHAPTPQPIMYPAVDEVYNNYKEHYQQQQQNPAPSEQQNLNHAGSQKDSAPQYYYPAEQTHSRHQQFYLIAMEPASYSQEEQQYDISSQPIYVQEDGQHQSGHHLATSENSPRSTHTKILFTQNAELRANDASNMYPLPSIRPFERHTPKSHPYYHQEYQQQQTSDQDFQQSATAESTSQQDTVAITQRPFNYHAHQSKIRSRPGRKRATAASKSAPSTPSPKAVAKIDDETEKHMQKIRQYVHEQLGAQTGSTIEIKTINTAKG